jgi:hypothetical protein
MRKAILGIAALAVLCSETALGQAKQGRDTIYVRVDSTTIDTSNNSFEFVLVYQLKSHPYEIYRVKNKDYSVEFEYHFSYSGNRKSYLCYTVHDLPTGVTWSIIFDKNTKIFYRTDVYDLKALGDKLVKESVDFLSGRSVRFVLQCGSVSLPIQPVLFQVFRSVTRN